MIIKQQWTIEEISIFSNSSHLEWKVGLSRHNFERDPPKDRPYQVWFNLVQGFQRRRFKCESLQRWMPIDDKSSKWAKKERKKRIHHRNIDIFSPQITSNNLKSLTDRQTSGEVIVHFVEIGGIDDHHCLNFLFIIPHFWACIQKCSEIGNEQELSQLAIIPIQNIIFPQSNFKG